MERKGYLYSEVVDGNGLRRLLSDFFQNENPFCILAEPLSTLYKIDPGIPSLLTQEGRVFSAKGEIRWKQDTDKFTIILLTEIPYSAVAVTPIAGEWLVAEHSYFLSDLNAPHISPSFDKYPVDAKKIKVVIFTRDGIALFTRLKEWQK